MPVHLLQDLGELAGDVRGVAVQHRGVAVGNLGRERLGQAQASPHGNTAIIGAPRGLEGGRLHETDLQGTNSHLAGGWFSTMTWPVKSATPLELEAT
jgi:hypothetical protein